MQELKVNYLQAEKKDAAAILDFLIRHFFPNEPCTKALGLTAAQMRPIYASLVERCLDFPFSTIVCLDDGRIVGCLLNSIWTRDDVEGEGADYDTEGDFESENLAKFVGLLNNCHEDFWSLAPRTCHVVLHREISCVAGAFQRRGIATSMLAANLSRAKIDEWAVDGVISETSSYANQQLLLKQGFRCLKEIPYADVVDSQGNRILKTDDGSEGLRLNLKLIGDYHIDY